MAIDLPGDGHSWEHTGYSGQEEPKVESAVIESGRRLMIVLCAEAMELPRHGSWSIEALRGSRIWKEASTMPSTALMIGITVAIIVCGATAFAMLLHSPGWLKD